MRILHLSDLHIGKIINNFSMIEGQRYVLQHVLGMLKEQQIDALLLAGDLYDKSLPSEEAVRLLDWFLSEVASTGTPCLAIPGNHDSADRLAFAQQLLAKQGVYIPSSFDGSVSHVTLEDQHGPVTFWLLPYIRPIDARHAFPDAQIGADYTLAVHTVLENCEIDTSQRNVILSHQFVTAMGADTTRETEEINLGGLDNVDVSAYESFDYVALGHVHRPQRIGRETARYSGSLLKYSFSEANYEKSAVLVSLGPKTAEQQPGQCVTIERIPLVPLHDMRIITGELDELTSQQDAGFALSHDYVHVVLTDKTPRIDAMTRLRSAYPNIMSLEYRNDSTASSTQEVLEATDIEAINPFEAFNTFYQQQTGGHQLTSNQSELVSTLLQRALEEGVAQ